MGYTDNQKPKAAGSIYINPPKNASTEVVEKGKRAIKFLLDNKFYQEVSIKTGEGSYDKYTAFFNGFKKTDKDRDLTLYPKQGQSGGAKKPQAPANTDDDLPF